MLLDPPGAITRLVVAVVNPDDADTVVDLILDRGFRVTRINTGGGFLRRGNTTLLLGVPAARVDELLALFEDTCHTRIVPALDRIISLGVDAVPLVPVDIEVGGAIVFALEVEQTIYLTG